MTIRVHPLDSSETYIQDMGPSRRLVGAEVVTRSIVLTACLGGWSATKQCQIGYYAGPNIDSAS